MLCSERRVTCGEVSGVKRKQLATHSGVMRPGLVEGKFVKDILLDTGCSRTLVHLSLVPESKLKEGNAVAIHWPHGVLLEVRGELCHSSSTSDLSNQGVTA